jgi:CRP/FNR family transcriptional regulator
VFTENCFPFSAVASMDTTLLYFPKERILEKIKTNQELALFFIQLMAKRCLKLNQVIENIGQEELPIRLARYLLRLLADQPELVQNNQATIQLTIPKKDLASQLATIPETLSRVFEKLQQQNLLQVSGKTIFIFDVKNLQSLI